MGCDIHSIFQKKEGDSWVDVESRYGDERHYALFTWLAGVRCVLGIEPISRPRGLPVDFPVVHGEDHPIDRNSLRGMRAEWFKEEDGDPKNPDHLRMWMGDHSFSWLTADEILAAPIPIEGDHFDYFIREVRRLKELYGEVRMVFGFDS